MNRSKQLDLLLYFLYVVFFISIFCSLRAVSSIATALIVITSLIKNKTDTGSWWCIRFTNPMLLACCLFYVLQMATLFYTDNLSGGIKNLQVKSAMVFVPLIVCTSMWLSATVREKLMHYFVWSLAGMLLYCLVTSLYKFFFAGSGNDVFFYHALVTPFKQHAVQVSIYTFIALVFLLEKVHKGKAASNSGLHILLVFYFTGCILLLSSKLVISFSAGCLLYYFLLMLKTKMNNRFVSYVAMAAGFLIIILALTTQNRISKRFSEIVSGDLRVVEQKDFNPGMYFNGLQFRLLEWRFVREILTEQHAWMKGVSDDAQKLLDEKYTSTHMYTGDSTGKGGYLSYNTHDQFLQALLETGIPGLIFFLLICIAVIYLAVHRKNRELTIIVSLLIAYCFNEAVFETQYGLILFIFFPLFLFYGTEKAAMPSISFT